MIHNKWSLARGRVFSSVRRTSRPAKTTGGRLTCLSLSLYRSLCLCLAISLSLCLALSPAVAPLSQMMYFTLVNVSIHSSKPMENREKRLCGVSKTHLWNSTQSQKLYCLKCFFFVFFVLTPLLQHLGFGVFVFGTKRRRCFADAFTNAHIIVGRR